MSISKAEAARRLLTIKKASTSYLDFVKAVYPDFRLPDFQIKLINALDALEKGELVNDHGHPVRKLLITMPPRHAKSTYCTQTFPVYYLARKPGRKVISASYNTDLAQTFGRMARDLMREPIVAQTFPDVELQRDSSAVADWRTTNGGRYYATSTDGDLSGRPATLFITDDPIKNRSEAESPTYRDRRWQDYVSASTTRLEPEPDGTPPIEIMILTRWHPDDVAGRLMETDNWETEWHHINFPAIIMKPTEIRMLRSQLPKDDPRYVPSSEIGNLSKKKRDIFIDKEVALWPERVPLEELKKRRQLDPREFEALYQQNPTIRGGNVIKSTWWRRYTERPETPIVVISADTAYKKSEKSDYSVFGVWGMDLLSDIYLLDVIRRRMDFAELKRCAIQLNAKWRGRGLRGMYVEDHASGQSLIQELRRESGVSVIPHKVAGDKVTRVQAVLPLIEGGRVFIPQNAPWLEDFLVEAEQFPDSAHDDQMDMTSIGLDVMARIGGNASADFGGPIHMDTSLNATMRPLTSSSPSWGEPGLFDPNSFLKSFR